jgi:hypothetical protein
MLLRYRFAIELLFLLSRLTCDVNDAKKFHPGVNLTVLGVRKEVKRGFSSLFIVDLKSDFTELKRMLVEYKYASKAPSTRKQYEGAWQRFAMWAIVNDLPILPTTPETIDYYLMHQLKGKKAVSPAQMALAAISDKHVALGLVNPCVSPTIKMTLQGIKRLCGKPPVAARAMHKCLVKGLVHRAIGRDIDSFGRERASLTMWREAWRELICFLSLSRFSDLNRVKRKDVLIEGDKVAINFLTRKNDQTHVGHTVYLCRAPGSRYCPVRLTQLYLARLPKDPDTPMLPDLSQKWLFARPATYGACRTQQKRLLRRLGLDPEPYGLHSARVGGCECLDGADVDEDDMIILAGWAAGSKMPTHYTKAAKRKWSRHATKLNM